MQGLNLRLTAFKADMLLTELPCLALRKFKDAYVYKFTLHKPKEALILY